MLGLELSSDSWDSHGSAESEQVHEWIEDSSAGYVRSPAPAAGQEPRVETRKDSDRLLNLRNDVQSAARTLETNRIAPTAGTKPAEMLPKFIAMSGRSRIGLFHQF